MSKLVEVNKPGNFRFSSLTEKIEVGESKKEALELGLKHYLGKLCPHNHAAIGHPENSLRCRDGSCAMCRYQYTAKSNRKRRSNVPEEKEAKKQAKARHSLEDIKLARELGISVEELLS